MAVAFRSAKVARPGREGRVKYRTARINSQPTNKQRGRDVLSRSERRLCPGCRSLRHCSCLRRFAETAINKTNFSPTKRCTDLRSHSLQQHGRLRRIVVPLRGPRLATLGNGLPTSRREPALSFEATHFARSQSEADHASVNRQRPGRLSVPLHERHRLAEAQSRRAKVLGQLSGSWWVPVGR